MVNANGLALLCVLIATPVTVVASPPVGLLASAATAQTRLGTIKGRLVWGGAEAPKSQVIVEKGSAKKDPEVCARDGAIPDDSLVVDPKTKGVRNGFVYLPKPVGKNPDALKALVAKNPKVVIDQQNCRFVPHVFAVTPEQTVVFQSSDPVGHNIRNSPFKNSPLNRMLAPKGQMESTFVAERFPIRVQCDLHPWMESYMMILDHPFFAITGEDGSFEIQGVPAGPQKLVVWQERVGYVTPDKAQGKLIDVDPDKTLDLGNILLDPATVKAK